MGHPARARRARKAAAIRRGRVRRVQVRLPRRLQGEIRRSRRGVVVSIRVLARARGGVPVAEGPLATTTKRLRVRRTRPAS